MFAVVEHRAGGVGGKRDRPGHREGKCRPDTGGDASSDAQGDEGKSRYSARVCRCLGAVRIRLPAAWARTLIIGFALFCA